MKSFRSYVPILNWLPGYDRGWLRLDLIAGLTLAALVVPEGMAYAPLAGMPPQAALYGAWIALILYAFFGSSRQLVVGAASAIAIMSASVISEFAPLGSQEFIGLSMALAMAVGVVAILAGLLRLGRIAQFFSESVLVGFVSGLALLIIIKQAPKLFGLEASQGNFWERAIDLVLHLPETHRLTLIVGISSLLLMIAVERWMHSIPAALVAVVYGIVVATVFSLAAQDVHVVGDIPAGLAPPALPDLTVRQWLALLPGALGITLVAFAEAIGPVRSFAGKHRYGVDADQELIGIGAANLGAGLFQGFSVGPSLSRSAAADNAGMRSQAAGLIAAAITMVVALFLTPLFKNLPEATLGAIVIIAVVRMFKLSELRRLYRVRRADFALAIVAMLGVLTFDEVLAGLLLAVIISLLALIYRASQPRLTVLERKSGRLSFEDIEREAETIPVPGLLIVRPDEGLFFANAAPLREDILARVAASERPLEAVLIDLEMSNDLDAPSAHELAALHEDLQAAGARLLLSRVYPDVRVMLERSGALERIGADNLFNRGMDAMVAHMRTVDQGGAAVLEMMEDGLQRMHGLVSAAAARAAGSERERLEKLQASLQASLDSIDKLTPD